MHWLSGHVVGERPTGGRSASTGPYWATDDAATPIMRPGTRHRKGGNVAVTFGNLDASKKGMFTSNLCQSAPRHPPRTLRSIPGYHRNPTEA